MKWMISAVLVLGGFLAVPVLAAPPERMTTPAPVIFLADNLDERDNLGWCFDTQGRGFSDRLHAHSCKPNGGDVQFRFHQAAGQIESAAFAGKCLTILPAEADTDFGLLDCQDGAQNQMFAYDSGTGEFRPGKDKSLCIAVGRQSRAAGPFMSRALVLSPCSTEAKRFKRWMIKGQ